MQRLIIRLVHQVKYPKQLQILVYLLLDCIHQVLSMAKYRLQVMHDLKLYLVQFVQLNLPKRFAKDCLCYPSPIL